MERLRQIVLLEDNVTKAMHSLEAKFFLPDSEEIVLARLSKLEEHLEALKWYLLKPEVEEK